MVAKKKAVAKGGAAIKVVEEETKPSSEVEVQPPKQRGKKPCPACNEQIASAKKKCKCGHEFTPSATRSSGGKKSSTSSTGAIGFDDQLEQAQRFIDASGGIDKAMELLRAVYLVYHSPPPSKG